MTVWVLQQHLTAEEEARIHERARLVVPFAGVPDLSGMQDDPGKLRRLLNILYPDDPPESVTRRYDYIWNRFSNLHVEDMLVVPLPARGEMALAEVTGPYEYAVGDGGEDMHFVPVKWYPQLVSMKSLAKHQELFSPQGMFEVTTQEARTALRDKLPHGYNRFAQWKWLLIVFFVLGLVNMMMHH